MSTNKGTIDHWANNSTGILANTNLAGTITNSGTITIDENYTATDTESDGDIDGPFAQGHEPVRHPRARRRDVHREHV